MSKELTDKGDQIANDRLEEQLERTGVGEERTSQKYGLQMPTFEEALVAGSARRTQQFYEVPMYR